jgi:hypothetical protein
MLSATPHDVECFHVKLDKFIPCSHVVLVQTRLGKSTSTYLPLYDLTKKYKIADSTCLLEY